jgi:hypothetical protein
MFGCVVFCIDDGVISVATPYLEQTAESNSGNL